MILMDVMEDLEDEGIPFQRNVPVGMMVEVPSAVILADNFEGSGLLLDWYERPDSIHSGM